MSSSSSVSSLDALLGLAGAKRAVAKLVARESGVHAVLFYGAEGSGKRTLARILAKAWMCLQPTEHGACGECRVCHAFDTGRAVDFEAVEPGGKSAFITRELIKFHPGDKEQPIVPVLDFFATRPLVARHKVVLLAEAHRMHPAAANSLLKTLEEPNAYAKLVLTTSQLSGVPSTIRSRCVAIACELPTPDLLAAEMPDMGRPELLLGEGSPGRTQVVRQSGPGYGALVDLLDSTRTCQPGAALRISESCRAITDQIAKDLNLQARAANVEVMRCIADWLAEERPERPDLAQRAAELHRLVQGNANASLALDALFQRILESE